MAFYVDTVVLLDRTKSTRTLVDSTQSGYTNTGIPNGDLTSWRKRLELVILEKQNQIIMVVLN